MVITEADKMTKLLLVNCNCGCDEAIQLKKLKEYDDEYYLSLITSKFSAKQCGIFRTIGHRINLAWKMLRGKEYLLTEVVLNKEEFEHLKDILKEF